MCITVSVFVFCGGGDLEDFAGTVRPVCETICDAFCANVDQWFSTEGAGDS